MTKSSKFTAVVLCSMVACTLFGSCGSEQMAPSSTQPLSAGFSVDSMRILDRMDSQEKAWSNGDLDGFMAPYWKSDSLLFVGSRGPSWGWQVTLDNYRKSYPSSEAMGTLTFEVEDLQPAGPDYALMLGAWHLAREEGLDDLSGWFSLVWRRIGEDWVIVRDHSS